MWISFHPYSFIPGDKQVKCILQYISKNECYCMATEVKQSNVSYNKWYKWWDEFEWEYWLDKISNYELCTKNGFLSMATEVKKFTVLYNRWYKGLEHAFRIKTVEKYLKENMELTWGMSERETSER